MNTLDAVYLGDLGDLQHGNILNVIQEMNRQQRSTVKDLCWTDQVTSGFMSMRLRRHKGPDAWKGSGPGFMLCHYFGILNHL